VKINGSAAKTSYFYKKKKQYFPNWKLIYKFKCTSTEYLLDEYLKLNNLKNIPIAIFSRSQSLGFGRYERKWFSPNGGIWFSAAYPIKSKTFISELFSISIAYKLCEMLSEESINVSLKWPNDIFYGSKKLIGFLPKVVTRGEQTNYVRVGFGMNLNNKSPLKGISLCKILNKKNLCESYWSSKILHAFNEAININKKRNLIIDGANKFLNKTHLPKEYIDNDWIIKNIDSSGGLVISKDEDQKIINL